MELKILTGHVERFSMVTAVFKITGEIPNVESILKDFLVVYSLERKEDSLFLSIKSPSTRVIGELKRRLSSKKDRKTFVELWELRRNDSIKLDEGPLKYGWSVKPFFKKSTTYLRLHPLVANGNFLNSNVELWCYYSSIKERPAVIAFLDGRDWEGKDLVKGAETNA